jgi:GR25 family glycosyltransferase involved in LPS biosynthesis
MHYYLIHGIDPERKPFMENQFEKFGVPKDKTTWITYPNKHDPMPDNLSHNPDIEKGLLSCGYKHYLAIKDICDNNYDYGVIMEDNIEFLGDVPTAIAKYLKHLPEDWDILFDSDFYGFKAPEYLENMNKCVYKTPNMTKGAHFYFLNLKFAKRLLEIFLPFNEAPDHHYGDLFKKTNANVYWAEPPNVHKILRVSTWMDIPQYNLGTIDSVYYDEYMESRKQHQSPKMLKWLKRIG